ncbi:hypothetical protein AK812_SmicGene18755 [Symbiodinium microadriaticum]|uniref:Uncharacterized protein n=1 Tax=Symbiodinium microadriaticum TaxID=2951 RepID=A0A1Q9DUB1_SYMMI|nr:hypothetical protein AK812_SmicGene18755 [Symbiodinium microadriaticum]
MTDYLPFCLSRFSDTWDVSPAWQQEVFREMQAKLDRYERDEPSPRLLKSREEEVTQPAQTQPPPFSQKQQREILQEFQRQQEENLRQQRDMEDWHSRCVVPHQN